MARFLPYASVVVAAIALFANYFVRDRAMLPRHSTTRELPWASHGEKVESTNQRGINDAVVMHQPDRALVKRALDRRECVRWNPYILGGVPQSASTLAETLYPPNLLTACLPLDLAPAAAVALHWIISGLGCLRLLRAYGVSRSGSVLGALLWCVSGWSTAHVENTPLYATASWYFWGLWAIELVANGRPRAGFALLTISVLLTWLAGFVQIAVYMYLGWAVSGIVALTAAVISRRRTMRGAFAAAATMIGAAAIGLLLAAPKIWPAAELSERSRRGRASAAALGAETWRPAASLGLVAPDLFGDPLREPSWRDAPFARIILGEGDDVRPPEITNWVERTVFFGGLAIFSALLGLRCLNRPGAAAAAITATIGFAAASSTSIVRVLDPLGVFSIGAPARAVVLPCLALPILAAFGFDRHFRGFGRVAERRSLMSPSVIVSSALAGIACAGVVWAHLFPEAALRRLIVSMQTLGVERRFSIRESRPVEAYLDLLRPGFLSLRSDIARLAVVFFAIAASTSLSRRRLPIAAAAVFFVATVVDPLHYFLRMHQGVPRARLYEETPGIEFLRANIGVDRIVRISENRETAAADMHVLYPPNLATYACIRDAQGYRELVSKRYLDLWDGMPGVLRAAGFSGIGAENASSPILDLCRVKFMIAARPIEALASRLKYPAAVGAAADLYVYENPDPMPEFAFFADAEFVNDAESSKRVRKPDFDPRRTLVVEFAARADHAALDAMRDASTAAASIPARRELEVVRRSDDEILLRLAPGPAGYILRTDSFDPGWTADADGENRDILPADYAFSAIEVRAGDRNLRLRFSPGSRRNGFKIALGAAIAAIAVWTVLGVRKDPAAAA